MTPSTTKTNDNACPDCGGATRVVTAVTVKTLGDPRQVLVTRACLSSGCQLKFPVFKPEDRLGSDEKAVWHSR